MTGFVEPSALMKNRFKPEREGEHAYTGISQSATREMALCAELSHTNVIQHIETILQDKSIFMVFQYCEHDLLQLIHHHTQNPRHLMRESTVRSILYQLLQGCDYLHTNWVMHRDLKPANIMVNSAGQVMIGDLGLARIFREPLVPLYSGDKVVVTIWYRAPELLLGGKHYTPAVDLWAIGCIFAELLTLRPIFKGEEAKMDNKKTIPFQMNQMQKIIEVLGMPDERNWPNIRFYPEYPKLASMKSLSNAPAPSSGLGPWYNQTLSTRQWSPDGSLAEEGWSLLSGLLTYNPETRLTARQALSHPYFTRKLPSANCFEGLVIPYPRRKITQEDSHGNNSSGTKRSGFPDDSSTVRPAKRLKE